MWTGTRFSQSKASVDGFLAAIWRSRIGLIAWVGLCVAVAVAHIAITKPEFIGAAQLLLQNRRVTQDGPEAERLQAQLVIDSRQVETQLGLIRSERLLRYVFDRFQWGQPDPAGAGSAAERRRSATTFADFAARVSARQVGLSYVVEIGYRAADPREAARVVNAIAAAYVHDRVTVTATSARVNTPYLSARIAGIVAEAMIADEAVRAGSLPDADFADADVRFLGPAIEPARAYPRPLPILLFAIGLGCLTGLLAISFIHHGDATIRSQRQVTDRFSLDCVSLDLSGPDLSRRPAMQALARSMTSAASVGLLSWRDSGASRSVAAGLAALAGQGGARPTVLEFGAGGSGEGAAPSLRDLAADLRSRSATRPLVVVLPALEESFAGQALSPLLGAALLVVQAHQGTVHDVRAAIRALRAVGASFAAVVLVFVPRPGAT